MSPEKTKYDGFGELTVVLDRFEEAWQAESPPEIVEFLPQSESAAVRRQTLIALVAVDLECRWRRTLQDTSVASTTRLDSEVLPAYPRLEDYVAQYADLGSLDDLPLELISEEYRVRHRWGDRPNQQQYVERFVKHEGAALLNQLAEIDEELAQEECAHQLANTSMTSNTAADEKGRGGTARGDQHLGQRFGNYELLEKLGEGGMGVVYKARQLTANRLVALKLIRSDQLSRFLPKRRDAVLARFQNEVQAAAQVDHDHVVTVYDVGEVDGQSYYAMQFVEGESLREKVADGPLDPKAAARYVQQVAEALGAAHEQGILHRDVKPHNVMVDAKTDRALLADFGLAKLAEGDQQLTATDSPLGSPPYMSPEQTVDARKVTKASDIYGVGATLYHLLTGRPPFQAASIADTLIQVRTQEPISPRTLTPSVPKDLDTICLKCLEKEPDKRYDGAQPLAEDLRRFLRGEEIQARPISRTEKLWRWCKRNPQITALSAIAASAMVIGTALSLFYAIDSQKSAADAIAARDDLIRAQVDMLLSATPDAAAAILRALEKEESSEKAKIVDRLRSLIAGEGNSKQEIRVRLGLLVLDGDERQITFLQDAMLSVEDIDEFLLIRDELAQRFSSEHKQDLWKSVMSGESATIVRLDRQQWLRAAAALAKWDPQSSNWNVLAMVVAEGLSMQKPLELGKWIEAFLPVGTKLVEPLRAIYGGRAGDSVEMQPNSASALAVYLRDEPTELSALIPHAVDLRQFLPLVEGMKDHANEVSSILSDVLSEGPHTVIGAGGLNEQAIQDRLAHFDRQANAAAALLVIGTGDEVWPLLTHSNDPTRRTILIHRFRTLGVDPGLLFAGIAGDQREDSIRRAIILALGEYPAQRIPSGDLERYAKKLLELYRKASDPGIHAAAEWTLNRWKRDERLRSKNKLMDLESEMKLAKAGWTGKPNMENTEKPRWYLSPSGQKMVIIPEPGEVQIGSPQSEVGRDRVENQRNVKIDWSFSIADKEVTKEQFTKFLNDRKYVKRLDLSAVPIKVFFRTQSNDASPIVNVTWYMAAAYCNWLTEKELGIKAAQDQFCYNLNDDGKFAENMTMPRNFIKRKGYRLPLEVEWEFACRAGTKTRWSHGEAENLLDRYANYTPAFPINQNRVSTVAGNLKPNDFGLFAMHGNALEWCQDVFHDDLSEYNFAEDLKVSGDGQGRATRGGSFIKAAFELRSANRYYSALDFTHNDSGFRVVRTIAPATP